MHCILLGRPPNRAAVTTKGMFQESSSFVNVISGERNVGTAAIDVVVIVYRNVSFTIFTLLVGSSTAHSYSIE